MLARRWKNGVHNYILNTAPRAIIQVKQLKAVGREPSGEGHCYRTGGLSLKQGGKPKVVFLMAGINDLAKNVPPQEVARNLNEIVEKLKAAQIHVVLHKILHTRTPIGIRPIKTSQRTH